MFTDIIKDCPTNIAPVTGTIYGVSLFGGLCEAAVKAAEKQDPNNFDKDGKIKSLEDAFSNDPVALKVAYMIATSHEYKDKPNVEAAIKFTKNYDWKESTMRVDKIQGIDKPLIKEKVLEIATSMKSDGENKYPLAVVDKFQGITPQSPGMKLCMDGNHRKEGLSMAGMKFTPVYLGKYTGNAEKSTAELIGNGTDDEDGIVTESSKHKKHLNKISLTSAEMDAVKAKYGDVECSFAKNVDTGKYFCHTYHAKSDEYDSPTDIPKSDVKFISSTS